MELGVRDWMIIIGALLIVAVLLDGYRRMRSRTGKVRVKLADLPPEELEPAATQAHRLHELPNGGARVVQREQLLAGGMVTETESLAGELSPEPDLAAGLSARRGENLDLLEGIEASQSEDMEEKLPANVAEEVVMLHVVARDGNGFAGEDILHILLACDMRFGDMDFFHRHEQAAGRGSIQFSVANMLQPGVFDIDKMSAFSTPGLIFFLRLPGPRDMMQAFDYMLETAQCVAENLGGDLLDESRSVATKQTLDHLRQRIRDMERLLLTHAGR